MNKRFVIIANADDNVSKNQVMTEHLFYDAKEGKIENCEFYHPYNCENFFKYILFRIWFSRKLNYYINFPGKKYWHILHKKKYPDKGNNVIFIFVPGVCVYKQLNHSILKEIKEKYPKAKLVLYLIDSMNRSIPDNFMWKQINEYFVYFDLIYTFDKKDCEKYGFLFAPIPYHKYEADKNVNINTDIYFMGSDSGRSKILSDIADYFQKKQTKYSFTVCNSNIVSRKKNIVYNDRSIPYKDIVREIQSTNCILEVLCDGATSNTLRYNEAVVYNKKLLTNNPNIYEMKYYDARYMKYFKNIDDIDIEWVKRREKVDYGYKDDFSVKNFLNLIDKNI